MTLGIPVTLRNQMLNVLENQMDANTANGVLIIYDGTRPATNGANTNVLAYLVLSKPAGSVAGGVLTFNSIGSEGSANLTGTATWARVYSGNLIPVYDCSVGTSGTDIILNTTSIVSGAAVNVTSGSITAGNPVLYTGQYADDFEFINSLSGQYQKFPVLDAIKNSNKKVSV